MLLHKGKGNRIGVANERTIRSCYSYTGSWALTTHLTTHNYPSIPLTTHLYSHLCNSTMVTAGEFRLLDFLNLLPHQHHLIHITTRTSVRSVY
jgi:hypothetical protein